MPITDEQLFLVCEHRVICRDMQSLSNICSASGYQKL